MKKNISKNPGIYIHIPFCDTKCGYCDFYSITDHSARKSFIKNLLKEIKHYATPPFSDNVFDTIYFGGGTPSLLTLSEMEKILSEIYQQYSICNDCEITVETNPATADIIKLAEYQKLGINRLSIGIQSFNDDELKYLGRIHSSQEAVQSYNDARSAGFGNISLDLIFAIPGQNITGWLNNLKQTIALKPEHISAYNLIFEEGTPFYKKLIAGQIKKQSEIQELNLYQETINQLDSEGYRLYEVSNYAQSDGVLSRHNYKYWNHTNYLGFGPSAHSYWEKKRWSNVRSIHRYIDNLKNGKTTIDFSENLTTDTLMFEKIMLGLRTSAGINLNEFETNFEKSFIHIHPNLTSDLLNGKYAEFEQGNFKLTQKGLLICDEILPRFAPN